MKTFVAAALLAMTALVVNAPVQARDLSAENTTTVRTTEE